MSEKNHGQKGYVRRNSGTSVILTPSPTDFTEWATVVEIRGSEDEAEQILSAFISATGFSQQDPLSPGGSDGGKFVSAQAHIQFGVGGVNMDLYCDVVLGGLIAVPASYMRVSVRLTPDPGGKMDGPITLRGGASENVRPGTINPQLTYPQAALAPNTSGTARPVPPFGRRVHAVIFPVVAAAGATLRFRAGNVDVGETAIPASPAQAAAIPNDVNRVTIRSGTLAITEARLVYEIQT